ncbi:MAG TPA: ligase-associated DNA damage response exonuclease [Saprospiraceae bacterium]|nr:ligase-associated DNA damage response exonuclease [Saprospiraceae bacterium]HMQ83397.1 ligase-associated DNA damage response exonuclease [Saprospiraceae bacterium]
MMPDLLVLTHKGIYCPPGDFYIDPWRPVKRAIITHGHADHAHPGHRYYLCTPSARPVLRYRLGPVAIETLPYAEKKSLNGVTVAFHPAGHIIGSAQVGVTYKGETWVVSGDYKLENDGLSEVFEPVKCHTFITESTFGLPAFQWKPQQAIWDEIIQWWQDCQQSGKTALLIAYALGKAQRIIRHLPTTLGNIFTHPAIENINEVIRQQGISLPPTVKITPKIKPKDLLGQLVLAPPMVLESSWVQKLAPVSIAVASGWMANSTTYKNHAVDRGFVLSDHADWSGLNQAVLATGAQTIIATHGYAEPFSQWLQEKYQLNARAVETPFDGDS